MRHISLPLSNGLMTKSGFERGLGKFCVCLRSSVRLVKFCSGGIQVDGLKYVGRLVVRGCFLKWNCFFVVWVRRLAIFRTR